MILPHDSRQAPARAPAPQLTLVEAPSQIGVPTSKYTDAALAEIYNQARTDYIVPMPMNAKRLREYIDHYDIDLDHSYVAVDTSDREPNGIIMMGARGDRGWVTRLGVIPERRRRRVGQFLMELLIQAAYDFNMRLVQLEVIKGNDPAQRLFEKMGFEFTRELLVIRRAPGRLADGPYVPSGSEVTPITDNFTDVLTDRESNPSWVEETISLLNTHSLSGYHLTLPDGETGWVVFQRSPFQLQHLTFNPDASPAMLTALLAQVHHSNPLQDTKVENVPADHPAWPIYQKFGYLESFRRNEMFLYL